MPKQQKSKKKPSKRPKQPKQYLSYYEGTFWARQIEIPKKYGTFDSIDLKLWRPGPEVLKYWKVPKLSSASDPIPETRHIVLTMADLDDEHYRQTRLGVYADWGNFYLWKARRSVTKWLQEIKAKFVVKKV